MMKKDTNFDHQFEHQLWDEKFCVGNFFIPLSS